METIVKNFVSSCDIISVHVEACKDPEFIIKTVKEAGKKISFALKPETSIEELEKFVDKLDFILVLSVNPGAAGQEFIDMTEKITSLRVLLKEKNLDVKIIVDGGMNKETATLVRNAGADYIVSASYIFSNDYKEAIENLRG